MADRIALAWQLCNEMNQNKLTIVSRNCGFTMGYI